MVNICTLFGHIAGTCCALCHQPGPGLCVSCLESLPYNRHACPRCALPMPDSAPSDTWCADCQARTPDFDKVLAPLLYRTPVDDLVAQFKYHQQLHLGPLLAGICADSVRPGAERVQLLLPVPMQAQQLNQRGFNQAAELARQLSQQLGIPWTTDRLFKIAGNRHQQALKRGQRRRNVRGIFACHGSIPATVALIDDVMTTGATAGEASRILKSAGARHVEVWAVARTPRERWKTASSPDLER